MKTTPTPLGLFEPYTPAWNACLKLWPLFLVQFVFVILEYAVLWVLALVLVGPFFRDNWAVIEEGIKDPNNYDWSPLGTTAINYFSDTNWVLTAIGAALLYTLWWSFLSAFANGGVYGAFWSHLEKGTAFSHREFLKNGVAYLLQMLFYQTLLFLLYLAFAVGFLVFFLLGVALIGFLFSHSTVAGVLLLLFLGLPFGLASLVFLIAFATYIFLWKAEITRERNAGTGMGRALQVAWDSMVEAAKRFMENRWRIGMGLIVAFLVYFVVSFACRIFFGILGIIPFLGLFFGLVDLLVATALVISFMTYMPALSVTYLVEEAG